MALNYKNKPMDWEAEGIEPTEELKNKGWEAGYKPPAEYFNYQWHNTFNCLSELQEKLSEFYNEYKDDYTEFRSDVTGISTGLAKKSDVGHKHNADDLTGILPVTNGGTGVTTKEELLRIFGIQKSEHKKQDAFESGALIKIAEIDVSEISVNAGKNSVVSELVIMSGYKSINRNIRTTHIDKFDINILLKEIICYKQLVVKQGYVVITKNGDTTSNPTFQNLVFYLNSDKLNICLQIPTPTAGQENYVAKRTDYSIECRVINKGNADIELKDISSYVKTVNDIEIFGLEIE